MGMKWRMASWGVAATSVALPWALRVYQRGDWESRVQLAGLQDCGYDLALITQRAMWLWLGLAVLALGMNLLELWWCRPASFKRWLEALAVSSPLTVVPWLAMAWVAWFW